MSRREVLWLAVCAAALAAMPELARACPHRVKIEVKRVVDGSKTMEALYRRVSGQDARTKAAGVTADIDAWRPDVPGSARVMEPYLIAGDREALQRYVAEVGKEYDQAYGTPGEHQFVVGFTAGPSGGVAWRTYYVEARARLDDSAIVRAELAKRGNAAHTVEVTLDAAGARRFAELTRASLGHKIAVLVDGVVVSAALVAAEVKGGRFWIPLESDQAAQSVLDRLACTRE